MVQCPKCGTLIAAPTPYPFSDFDMALCGAFLDAVEQTGGISFVDSVEVLVLSAYRAIETFLGAEQKKRLRRARKAVPAFLATDGVPLDVVECRDYLELRKAIRIDRNRPGQWITAGPRFAEVRAKFPPEVKDIVALALIARSKLRVIRETFGKEVE